MAEETAEFIPEFVESDPAPEPTADERLALAEARVSELEQLQEARIAQFTTAVTNLQTDIGTARAEITQAIAEYRALAEDARAAAVEARAEAENAQRIAQTAWLGLYRFDQQVAAIRTELSLAPAQAEPVVEPVAEPS